MIRLGIDTGGTFTDVVALDEATGRLVSAKVSSTPADPATGLVTAAARGLALLGGAGDAVGSVWHGTTVATNLLLEDRVENLGFITTEGFEFLLEIGRQGVPDGYGNSYFWVKPPRIVPAHLVRGVGGRLNATGAEVRPLDVASAVAAARFFAARGIEAVGVCLLHAYANPDHEQRVRDVLAAEHPECAVSLSSEVLPEYREYERAVTTLVDAAVKPPLGRYLAGAARRLAAATRPDLPLRVMTSGGGVLSAAQVVRRPIGTVLSGPAAGALGAALVAGDAGHDAVITLDGGGTSTDVAVVHGGRVGLTTDGRVGRYPVRVPMVDLVTVGAGGGSIAWLSPEGTLKVGPRSAGAEPGPLCYHRGGTEVTVTDAHLVLGRIPPALADGKLALDVAAAMTGVAALAGRLGLSPAATAEGVVELSAVTAANAIRQVTVARGLDVREYTLVAFGGSGPLSACRLLDLLGLPAALVPLDPGNLSAFGLLTVDVRTDGVRTLAARDDELDVAAVARVLAELRRQAGDTLVGEGYPPADHAFQVGADLRYLGQADEVAVAAPAGAVDRGWADAVVAAFHAAHAARYGYQLADDPRQHVEWVNLRVTATGPVRRPVLPRLPAGDGDPGRALAGRRRVHFGEEVPAPVYRRAQLRAGDRVTGPAVVEEPGATLPVHPGFAAVAQPGGGLLLTRCPA